MIAWSRHQDGDQVRVLAQSGLLFQDAKAAADHPRPPDPGVRTAPARARHAAPPSDRARWMSGAVVGLIALGIYLVAWLIAGALPLLSHPEWAQLDQSGMDPNFYVWGLRWWPYALSHRLDPLHSTLVQVPRGVSLAWSTTIPPLAVLAWPITALAGPVASFGLLVVASLPVSAWAAFILCRRITGRFWPSLAAGAIYGFSAYATSHLLEGQLNLSFGPLLPLMAYLVVVRLEKKIDTRLFVGLLGLAMAAQCYLFIETFADLTVVLAVALLCAYVVAGRASRPVVAKLAKPIGLAYLLALALAAPFLWDAIRQVPPGFVRPPDGVSLDLLSLVMWRPGNALGLGWLVPRHPAIWQRGGFAGVPLLLVALALTVGNWSNKIVRFLAVMLVFVVVAALGPAVRVNGVPAVAFPWGRLWYLPIVRSSFPVRLMVFAFLALAVMTAIWLANSYKAPWRLWPRWLLVVVAIIAIATNSTGLKLSHRPGLPAFITTGQYRHYIAPGATVVVIATHTGNAGLLYQAETDFYFRLAGGYFNQALNEDVIPPAISGMVSGKNTTLTPYKIRQFRTFVRAAKVSAILVQAGSMRAWRWKFEALGLRPRYLSGVTLYEISQKYRDAKNFGERG
jgi:hypothetical protein